MKKSLFILSAASIIGFTACGSNETKTEETSANTENATENNQAATPSDKQVVELLVEADDDMKFNTDKIEVPAGSMVRLVFHNKGKMPKEAMGHNFTILAAGVSVEDYGKQAMMAKDNDYQVADRYADVIANTKMLGPDEMETLEFDAPEPGTYKFLCTFPGHYGSMQGDFIVK